MAKKPKKPKPEDLGTGYAASAGKAIRDRRKTLDERIAEAESGIKKNNKYKN